MTFQYAGRYGPEAVTDRDGNAQLGTPIPVLDAAGAALATLYINATRTTQAANPVLSDAATGNLTFYADPGDYQLSTPSGLIPITVPMDPRDLPAHVAAADPHGDRADSTSKIATHSAATDPHGDRGYTDTRLAALVNAAPAALDTLNELALALGDDANFAATMTTALAGKLNVVVHGATAGTARPAAATQVLWIGTVAPTNAVTNDLWWDKTATLLKLWSGSAWQASGNGAYAPLAGEASAAIVAVADNCHATALDTPAQSAIGTSRCPHTVGVDCSDLRFVYTNWSSKSSSPHNDIDGTATLTVNAGVEIAGTIYRVTFGGRTSATIDAGGMIVSDPLGVEVAAGTVIYSRTYVNATAWYSNKKTPNVGGAGGFTTTTDLTAPGSGSIADAGLVLLYVPSAIIGVPKTLPPKALLVAGHSIPHGFGDGGGTNFPSYAVGFLSRAGGGYVADAVRGHLGCINIALSGDVVSDLVALAGHFRRGQMSRFCTHALVHDWRNDLSNGVALATIQANLLTACGLFARRGLKVVIPTELPRSTSTDNWTTLAGQTPHSTEPTRYSLNDWIRAGAPIDPNTLAAVAVGTSGALLAGQSGHPVTAYWELADTVESARNSGKWTINARSVTDAAITAAAQVLTSAIANFTAADLGAAVVVRGAGAAGADLANLRIATVTNATTVTLDNSAGTTVSGATAFIDLPTADGIHPTCHGHVTVAAGADLTKLT